MLQILRTRDVKIPERSGYNAGFDFFVPNDYEEYELFPMQNISIPSGIKVRLPENYTFIAFNKSGIAVKYGLHVGACVIDENYTGEIHINIINTSPDIHFIKPSMKLAQFILIKQDYYKVKEVKEEDLYKNFDINERGENGFGSSGIY